MGEGKTESRPRTRSPLSLLRHAVPLALIVATFLVLGMGELNRHVDLGEQDTPAYLSKSLAMREEGGILGFIRACVTGTYPNEYRHPLYMLALAPLARRDLSFFPAAKIATLAFGAGALLATYWAVWRAFGRSAAILATAMMGVNKWFVNISSMVACESLLMIFFVAAWGATPRDSEKARHYLLGGVWAGLSYMVKATGLILVWSFLVMVFARWRHRALARRGLWLFLMGFVLVAWPLMVRNAVVHGNPLHNANSKVTWLDNWEEWYSPEFEADPPSALRYWRTHTVRQMADRMLFGMRYQAEMFQIACLSPVGLPALPATLFTAAVLVAGLYGIFGSGFSWRNLFSGFILAAMFLAFSWHAAVVAHPRFMMPLAPVVCGYAASTALGWIRRATSRGDTGERSARAQKTERTILGVALGLVGAVGLWHACFDAAVWRSPAGSYALRPGYGELQEHLEKLPETAAYLIGPVHGYDFGWHSDMRGRRLEIPLVKDFKSLDAFIEAEGVRLVILHPRSIQRRSEALADFFRVDPAHGIVTQRVPRGWKLVLKDREGPVEYLMFRVQGTRAHMDE